MNKSLLFALFLILTALTLKAQTSTETPEAYQARMQWWHDARFGMFIHWGAYSVPAGVHNGIELPSASEWIMATGNITPKEYEQYPARFNPINFDADAWVKTARDAGMKYLVITSKHHDGFCIWDSKITGYDVMDFAPYKHDPLKDLSKACKKYGIRFGLYHSIFTVMNI
jgi:alpha-L-fucosidase